MSEEMRAIVDEAHRRRRKVATHACTIPDDVLRITAEKKIYLVPTDYAVDAYAELHVVVAAW